LSNLCVFQSNKMCQQQFPIYIPFFMKHLLGRNSIEIIFTFCLKYLNVVSNVFRFFISLIIDLSIHSRDPSMNHCQKKIRLGITLEMNGLIQVVTRAYYIPELKNKLLSIGQLQQKNLTIVFKRI